MEEEEERACFCFDAGGIFLKRVPALRAAKSSSILLWRWCDALCVCMCVCDEC